MNRRRIKVTSLFYFPKKKKKKKKWNIQNIQWIIFTVNMEQYFFLGTIFFNFTIIFKGNSGIV